MQNLAKIFPRYLEELGTVDLQEMFKETKQQKKIDLQIHRWSGGEKFRL